MERTNSTFVSPRAWMGALTTLFVLLGLQSALAQCPNPGGLTTLNIGQNTASLRWTSNDTPTDNCWVVTLGGSGMTLNAAGCPDGGQGLFTATVCYINNVVSFSAPVTSMVVSGTQITIGVGGLQPGTTYNWYVSETCDGFAPPFNVSGCAGPAAFQTLDAQYTVSATTVRPTCPFVSPGYVPNGSFTVTVTDGTTCTGTYNVTASPIANSGPAASTPPNTTVTGYFNFGDGNFLFPDAGAGCYTVTVTETGPCNPPTDPVVIVVCVPDGIDNTQPTFYVTDVLGNILADNDPLTAAGTTYNFGNVAVPEGECGRQDEYYVYGFDNCDGFIVAGNAVSASATTTPATIQPGTQVSVTPDGFGFYLVDVHWSTGSSTVSIFGRDAAGNIANNPTGLRLQMTVPDNIDPDVSLFTNTQFTIPVCATSTTGIVTVAIDDLCDQRDITAANINFSVGGGATFVVSFDPPAGYGGDPTPNWVEYLVTFPSSGSYLIGAGYTDAYGNTGFIDQGVNVQNAATDQPPTIQANAETVTLTACQSSAQIVYSFTISDDCAPINIAQVSFNGGGSGLPTINGGPFYYTDDVGPNTVYFEVIGNVGPAGAYFPTISYQNVDAFPTITVLQNANQPADIIMPGNLTFTVPQCQTNVVATASITIIDDCDNPINPANAVFTLGGAPLTPSFINAAAGYFEFVLDLTQAANDGDLLVARYTDAQGAVRLVEALITVNAQPDNWAPIIVYPSQDINVELDPCDEDPAIVFFEVTATDNCSGDINPLVQFAPAGGVQAALIAPSPGGDTYVFVAFPGVYQILITATDGFGNTRQEDFFIVITQDPAPQTNLGCADNLNVTLNDDCQALITPEMVLQGNFGCIDPANFNVQVVDGNLANGGIADGCGDFLYEVTLPAPPPVQGFTGAFAPGNWTVSLPAAQYGGSVNFTASTLTLNSPDGAFCSGGQEVSAAIAAPYAGVVSFNWAYANPDPGYEMFIIRVTAGATVTTVLNNATGGNTSGVVNINVNAGDVLLIIARATDCIAGSSTVNITNFLFTANDPYPNVDFTTCWGYVHIEDKTKPVIDCPNNTSQASVTQDVQLITGSLGPGDAQFDYTLYGCLLEFIAGPNQGGNSLPGLRYYDTYTFQVTETDIYTFLFASNIPGGLVPTGNGTAALYTGASFDPTSPCENIIAQNDQGYNPTNTAIILAPGGGLANASYSPELRVSLPLVAGQTYTLWTSTTLVNAVGDYTWTIVSDGNGQLVNVPVQQAVVSKTLICDDIDQVTVNTLAANIPRCYKTDRDGNVIFPTNFQQQQRLQTLLARLGLTGFPNAAAVDADVTDNCGFIEVCVTDVITTQGDCGVTTLTRTFSAKDKQDGDYVEPNNTACAGLPNTAVCSQVITVRKAQNTDLLYPPFTQYLECDEQFPVDANGNPHPSITGYPYVETAFGFHDLDQSYCNLSASYFDYPRAVNCESGYKFRREWTIFNWCAPANSRIWNQIIKVGDFSGPEITCNFPDNNWDGYPDVISTGPYDCTATFQVPAPIISDNCSDWTWSAQIVTDLVVPVLNQYGQQVGTTIQTVIVANFPGPFGPGSTLPVASNIPPGHHRVVYTATDDCGNISVEECEFWVKDLVEPVAVCDDDLHISIGGQGYAQVLASDIDEGSWDNCGDIRIEVSRLVEEDADCNAIPPYDTPWDDKVEFNCCDVHDVVTIRLQVWDDADKDGLFGAWHGNPDLNGDGQPDIDLDDNGNLCWLDVLVEDKLKPQCIAPHNVTVDCDDLPYNFPNQVTIADTSLLQDLFDNATGYDNCPGWSVKELAPISNLHDCGYGTIIRRWSVTDLWGNVSSNTCQQIITVQEVHNYEIKFPKDAAAVCGDPNPDTIETYELGCDLLAVSVDDEFFSASGDECYKIFRTYSVINWCEYNGQAPPVVVGRDEDCDNNPGDENIWVLVRQASGGSPKRTYYDRDNNEANNNPFPFTKSPSCDGLTNPAGHWINSDIDCQATKDPITGATQAAGVASCAPADNIRDIYSRGYWQYTQIIKVYDNIQPVIEVEPYEPFCSYSSDIAAGCPAEVVIDFTVDENCTPDDVTIHVFLDAFSDGVLDGEITASALSGTYPNYTITGTFPLGAHIFEVHAKDGCGNVEAIEIPFEVVDCKAPTPICINGLAIELMPVIPPADVDGDGTIDTGAMAIWASDFIASDVDDCTPPVKYSIHITDEVLNGTDIPNQSQTGLILTCSDPGTTVVRIYAWDSAYNPYAVQPDGTVGGPNYDFCETYVLVQDNMFDVCPDVVPGAGIISGVISTEGPDSETVEGVEVSLSGQASMNQATGSNGAFSFANLQTGYDYTVTPQLDVLPLNGVSTFDLVLISKHILGVQPLNSPYKMVAADVNNSKTITTQDLIALRRLILSVDTDFANNTSWRFIPANYSFPVPTNPWFEQFPEVANLNDLPAGTTVADFVGVKIGDVNASAQANLTSIEERDMQGLFAFQVADVEMTAGNEYTVAFTAADLAKVQGYQATLTLTSAVELVDVVYGVATAENFGLRFVGEGMITTSWNGEATSDVLFSLVLRAKADAQLSNVLSVSSRYTVAEAYNQAGDLLNVGINFSTGVVSAAGFELYQNTPNPFKGETMISWNQPEDAEAVLTISDVTGKVLKMIRTQANKGYNMFTVRSEELSAVGVLSYTVSTADFTATRKMVIIE
jgi:hypothetical protein